MSQWFNHAFPVPNKLCVPNLVPYDKFRPRNIEKEWEYIEHISKISPERLKYGNEKSLRGKAIFNKLARRDVLTGLIPPLMTDPYLRNRYSIIGICCICRRSAPVRYQITNATVDADLFSMEIEAAIAMRFLSAGGVLVLTMLQITQGKETMCLRNGLGGTFSACSFPPSSSSRVEPN